MVPSTGRVFSLAILFLSSVFAAAQTDVTIRLVDNTDRPVSVQAEVTLTDAMGGQTLQAGVAQHGEAHFSRVLPGQYAIKISGPGIESRTTNTITIYRNEPSRLETVEVTIVDKGATAAPHSTINVAELKIPDKARKEFDKGNADFRDGKPAEAEAHFRKALALYPQYSAAHNNLGVIAVRAGRLEEARSDFEASLQILPTQPEAEHNLVRLASMQRRWSEVEERSLRLTASDAKDAEALNFLAYAEAQLKKFRSVLEVVHRLHALPHPKYAAAHLLAARAAEAAHDVPAAVSEYKLYLEEAPAASDAAAVRVQVDRLMGL